LLARLTWGCSDSKGVSLVTFFAPAKKVTRSPEGSGSFASDRKKAKNKALDSDLRRNDEPTKEASKSRAERKTKLDSDSCRNDEPKEEVERRRQRSAPSYSRAHAHHPKGLRFGDDTEDED
jgi:hypothetical protein